MDQAGGQRRVSRVWLYGTSFVLATMGVVVACDKRDAKKPNDGEAVLRVGVAGLSPTNPIAGLRQLSQILSVEGLARLSEDGKPEPSLAERWTFGGDGRTLSVKLKPGVKFHDGSPLSAATVASVLSTTIRQTFGPIADDVERVAAVDALTVEITFARRSPFLLEALEAGIRKPGSPTIGTGPFAVAANSTSDLRAYHDYYGGKPLIEAIHVESVPAVRSAWAKLLRDELDMLWEVGPDALSSLEHSANVAVFTFTRRYQYIVALNSGSAALRSAAVRRALNVAIDRSKLIRDALNGHAVPSASPIWPRYWALDHALQQDNPYDPARAAAGLQAAQIHFTLLIPSDAVYERIALEMKRQFEAFGVDMEIRAASQDELFEAEQRGRYDAVLIEAISGPTLLRPYVLWHSKGAGNPGNFGDRTVDNAFDIMRNAATDSDYRTAVGSLQRAFNEDPPAIFLAWSVRARAISTRFAVQAEEGRDVLSTLRFWKPTSSRQRVSLN